MRVLFGAIQKKDSRKPHETSLTLKKKDISE